MRPSILLSEILDIIRNDNVTQAKVFRWDAAGDPNYQYESRLEVRNQLAGGRLRKPGTLLNATSDCNSTTSFVRFDRRDSIVPLVAMMQYCRTKLVNQCRIFFFFHRDDSNINCHSIYFAQKGIRYVTITNAVWRKKKTVRPRQQLTSVIGNESEFSFP